MSIVINVVLSLGFFLLIFGTHGPVQVWGVGGYVFDFVPQGFMIALMATLVPGMLAIKALKQGMIVTSSADAPRGLLKRAVGLGLAGAGAGVALAGTILAVTGVTALDWWPALLAKLVFGGVLAWLVTPIGLRALLCAR